MRLGVNVPNFGPGTNPDVLRRWALTVEGLGFDLLMMSDHIAITPDVAQEYQAPFYEPFTTLSWLAGITGRIRLGTTVIVVPYRHPLLIARMAANLNDLSGGRLVLGVGVGGFRQEFDALGVPFHERGRLADEYLLAIRAAWQDEGDYRSGQIPVWIGGNSDAALRRAVRLGDAWHPLRFTPGWMAEATGRLRASAAEQQRPQPGLIPRIALRLTSAPLTDGSRLAGHGTIDQIAGDLEQLRSLGADTVVLDPFNGDHQETAHPETAWLALATVAEHWHQQKSKTLIPNGAEVTNTEHADSGPGGIAPEDLPHLRRCVELAAEATDAGDFPFGSVLVAADGRVLAEDRNRENTMGDATRHPEFELARWAAANMTASDRAAATVFTSGEHCPMCSAAHAWVGLGRIVYVSSSQQLTAWLAELGVSPSPVRALAVSQVAPGLEVQGPVPGLDEQVHELHRRFRG